MLQNATTKCLFDIVSSVVSFYRGHAVVISDFGFTVRFFIALYAYSMVDWHNAVSKWIQNGYPEIGLLKWWTENKYFYKIIPGSASNISFSTLAKVQLINTFGSSVCHWLDAKELLWAEHIAFQIKICSRRRL